MFEALLGFASTYLSLMLLSTVISLGSLAVLRLSGERSYNVRIMLLMLPIVGGVIGELWQGIPCFIHQLSSGKDFIEHLLCGTLPFATMQATCFAWVAAIGVSLSITGIVWGFNHHFSDGIIKRVYGFKPLGRDEAGNLYDRLEDLAQKAGIEKPTLSLIESSKPDIFSIGRGERATVFLSVGLLETLSDEEVRAVLAHEVAHCKNYDSVLKSLIAGLRYSSILNPLGLLFEPAVSREREFLADADAVRLAGGPSHLISALGKLSFPFGTEFRKNQIGSLMSFSNLEKIRWRIFNKHPSVDERVNRLLKL